MKQKEEGVWNILSTAGMPTKWCVDLGALDGYRRSNTYRLIKEEGFSAVLIEANPLFFERLQKLYDGDKNVYLFNEYISFDGITLDSILAQTPIPKRFDFLSLDIDGAEYHVWRSLKNYTSRVVEVEFNPSFTNDYSFVQPKDMRIFQGSSLKAINELAKEKGYEIVATDGGVNAFFVENTTYPNFSIKDNSLDLIHTDKLYHTRLFQLYDGTIILDGCKDLIWQNEPIQLPQSGTYPARVSRSRLMRNVRYYAHKALKKFGLR